MPTDQALVLAAHGSHHDPRSADPAHAHAARLRERGCFDAVRPAFWKEQPSLAEVRSTIEARSVYVVPLTTSEGYFTDRVFPRELGLEGDARDGRAVSYTQPVGTHERLGDVVVERVHEVTAGDLDDADVGVALVGHGTERHANSADATVAHADRLRTAGRFAAVEPLFLDQSPAVADLAARFAVTDVVVVPLFVGNGHHVRRDIPAAVGIPSADGDPFGGPARVDGHRLWYAEAVGTAPGLSSVILDRAAEAGADVRSSPERRPTPTAAAETAFLRWLDRAEPTSAPGRAGPPSATARRWGELAITVAPTAGHGRRYAIRHLDDRGVPRRRLDRLAGPEAVRDRTATDDRGEHRPLRTARTLPRGWLVETADPDVVVRSVRAVYPASIDHWYRDRDGTIETAEFESVVARQVGRYRDLDGLDATTLASTVEACCGDCVRRPAWPAGADEDETAAGSFPCPEPCSFLLEAARSFAGMAPTGAVDDVDPAVPAAAFDRRGNRYRARFQEATRRRDSPAPEAITDP